MRPEGPTFHLEAGLAARHLQIMVQQLEPRIRRDTDPYHPGATKVRKGAHAAEGHLEWLVPSRHHVGGGCEARRVGLGNLPEELHGQVQLCGRHPREAGLRNAQWRNGVIQRRAYRFGQLNREEEAHPGGSASK